MKVVALFLVLTVVAVRSQVPKPCVAPSSMEARIIEIDPSRGFEVRAKMSYDSHNRRARIVDEVVHSDSRKEFMDVLFLHDVRNMEREYEIRSKLSYDARNLRKRYVDEVFTNGDKRDYYDVLYLHNVGKEYRVNLKTKTCEVRAVSQNRFYPIGIPENATFYGEANIGTKGFPGEGVLVQTWGGATERASTYHGYHSVCEIQWRIRKDYGERGGEPFPLLTAAKNDQGKEYRLNFKTKVCEVHAISHEFRPIGIPLNATFYGEASIGSKGEPGEGVTVQAWGGDSKFGRYNGVWTLTGCLPVREGYYSNQTGFISTEFFDITLGISDPNVFIPPKECTQ